MATYTIRVTRGGQPVVGAQVTAAGERLFQTTNAQGEVAATIAYANPIAVSLHVYKAGEIDWGGGPIRIEPGITRVVEV